MSGLEKFKIMNGTNWDKDVVLGYVKDTSKNMGGARVRVGDIEMDEVIANLSNEGAYHIGYEDKVLTVLHHGRVH
ncbi:hypothetical protein GOV13_04665 [Candidatus Pacearchaeota archaeon]|nr:hypothetical protein [Candidatus Pacearchaeota archaeon]